MAQNTRSRGIARRLLCVGPASYRRSLHPQSVRLLPRSLARINETVQLSRIAGERYHQAKRAMPRLNLISTVFLGCEWRHLTLSASATSTRCELKPDSLFALESATQFSAISLSHLDSVMSVRAGEARGPHVPLRFRRSPLLRRTYLMMTNRPSQRPARHRLTLRPLPIVDDGVVEDGKQRVEPIRMLAAMLLMANGSLG